MKKIIAGLFAGLILSAGAQTLELPQRQNTAYCYGDGSDYCWDGDRAPARGERGYAGRGGCGCTRGR